MAKDKPRSVTMQDIAEKAGVSKITVSRALGNGPVNDKTRKTVMEAAKMLGYQFNHAARNLRLQNTNTIAIVIELLSGSRGAVGEPYPMALLGGIIEELSRVDYTAVIMTVEKFMKLPPAVDAVILLGQGASNDAIHHIERCGLPFVVWGSAHGDRGRHIFVGSDNMHGGRLVGEHLIGQNRRRALFIGDPSYPEPADRINGFKLAFEAGGGSVISTIRCEFILEAGYEAMKEAIARFGDDFDAVFAASDGIAMGVIKALEEAGMSVPERVSVVGFDDAAAAQIFSPPLTTVRQNWHKGGYGLAQKAVALVEGHEPHTDIMPVELIIRSS